VNPNKTILLVEDSADDQEFIRNALKESELEHELLIMDDGALATEYLLGTDEKPGLSSTQIPRLILLDLSLPKLNGLDVLKRLRSDPRTQFSTIVVFSSSSEEKDISTSYNLGANSYVRKPVNINQFVDTVKLIGSYWLTLNHEPNRNE